MAGKAPGRSYREGLSLVEVIELFPDDEAARAWFEARLWPDGPYCPRCGSLDVQSGVTHPSMTHRCRDCPERPMFSLRTGTVMRGSKLGYRVWAVAIYLFMTSLKGVSSMKLHRDLGITQKNAWHLAHRIREAWDEDGDAAFGGPVEVDETFVGGKFKNKSRKARKKLRLAGVKGRGSVGKAVVIGAKDRDTKRVRARVVGNTDTKTLQEFVRESVGTGATVYTDEASGYKGMPFKHESVRHSAGEFVCGMAHTNGIESFWSLLKRGYQGTYHHLSKKHLARYVVEFAGRHNSRDADTLDMMGAVARGMVGKRLRFVDLVER